MPKTLKGGHRVLFIDDERLDIPDTEALPELVYDYINELSSMLGGGSATSLDAGLPVGGTLSELVFDTTTPSATTIYGPGGAATDKAVFSLSYEIDFGEFEHHILTYDPSASGQQTTVDLSTYNDGDTPYIWARRIDTNTDVDTRRKWNTVSNAEELTSIATRERYRIEFATSANTTPPTSDARWCPVAQVTLISGGETVFQFGLIHPFDLGTRPTSSNHYWGTLLPSASGTSYRYLGVPGAIYQLKELLDAETTARADADSTLGISILNNTGNITTNTNNIAALDARLAFNQMRSLRIGATGAGVWSLLEEIAPAGAAATTLTTTSPWVFELTTDFTIKHVQISPFRGISGIGAAPDLGILAQSSTTSDGTNIFVWVQTLQNLVAVAGYNWTSPPAGNPPNTVSLYILLGG